MSCRDVEVNLVWEGDARQVRLVQIPVVKNKCASMQLLSRVRFVSAYTQNEAKNSQVFDGILFSQNARFDMFMCGKYSK